MTPQEKLKEIESKHYSCEATKWLIRRVKRLEVVLKQYADYDSEGSTLKLLGRAARTALEVNDD